MILSKNYISASIFYLLFLLCISTGSVAQNKEISFKHLSTVDGLSNFTVFSIAQDQQGFMWFGTMDGLNRFDGKQIKIYKEDAEDPNSLGNSFIYSLQCSSDSGLWIGTNHGLYYYDFYHDNFRLVPIVDINGNKNARMNVRTLLVDENWLWIGTGQGLFRYDLLKEIFVPFDDNGHNKTTRSVNALNKSKDGTLWIGGNQGLMTFQNEIFTSIDIKIGSEQDISFNVLSIEFDDTGRIWFGTFDLEIGLIVYNPETQSCKILTQNDGHLPHNKVNCLFRFADGNMWAGTTWGLAIIDEKSFDSQHLLYERQDPGGISQNSIKHIFQGKNGVIWIGTYSGGVNYFDPKSQLIKHVTDKYDNENSLNFNIVSSIFEDKDKNLWIGTEYGGVNIYNQADKSFSVLKEKTGENCLISDNVKSVIEDQKGRKFIGTQFGLSIYNSANNSFFNISNKPGNRGFLNSPTVHDLCLDKWGNIWVGATGGNAHFQMYDIIKDTIVHFFPAKQNFPTINNAPVNSMVYDENRNTVWAGGVNGLAGFNIQTKKYVTDDLFLPAASILQDIIINDVFLDNNRLLWIATFGKGLFIMDVETYQFRKVDRDDGLLESSFYAIISDNDGNIWTSVNAHLLKITKLTSLKDPIVNIEKYGIQEGFPPQQYFLTTACKGSDGALYFGGDDGFISFNPLEVEHIVFHPSVAVLDILVNGKSLEIKSKKEDQYLNVASQANVTLTYDQSSFAVEFIGPN